MKMVVQYRDSQVIGWRAFFFDLLCHMVKLAASNKPIVVLVRFVHTRIQSNNNHSVCVVKTEDITWSWAFTIHMKIPCDSWIQVAKKSFSIESR